MKYHLRLSMILVALLASALAMPAAAELTAYVRIPDIPGESTFKAREGWIDLAGFEYAVQREIASNQVGRGRARSRAEVAPVVLKKWADGLCVSEPGYLPG